MKNLLFVLFLYSNIINAQIIAPDFTLTDIHGNTRNLYQETDAGKIVVIDFFNVYCGTCITNTPALENIWQTYGYNGDSLWVWGIETMGIADSSVLEFENNYFSTFPLYGTSQDDIVIYLYNISYTPQYFVVCPDRNMKGYAIDNIVNGINNCLATDISDYNNSINLNVYYNSGMITISNIGSIQYEVNFELYGLSSFCLISPIKILNGETKTILHNKKGMFFYRLIDNSGNVIKKGKLITGV